MIINYSCSKINRQLTPGIFPPGTGFIMVYIFSPPLLLLSCGLGMIGVPGPGGPVDPGGPP